MGKEITLGQYYPADSILHRLDPRVKILGTLLFFISLFAYQGAAGFVLVTVFLAAMLLVSRIPLSYTLKGIRGIFVLCVITAVFNLLFTPGTPLVQWKGILITKEGVKTAVFIAIRLIYLVLGASLMTLATTPNQLTDGLEKSCSFLKKFGVPVHEIAMMMTIALRFIPILMEEAEKIKKAQMARGADFENGNLWKRLKSYVPVLVPLFVSAFRRAQDLALAMESRCYHGGEGRTRLHPLRYERRDFVAYAVVIAYLAAVVALRFLFPAAVPLA